VENHSLGLWIGVTTGHARGCPFETDYTARQKKWLQDMQDKASRVTK